MKVTTTRGEGFKPVTLTLVLETQEEVNALYIIGNYERDIATLLEGKSSSVGAVKKPSVGKILNKVYIALREYKLKE